MPEKMKVLIAYDGVNNITRIINDLKLAGLPHAVEARVVTVVDAFVAPDLGYAEASLPESSIAYIENAREAALARIKREVEQARKMAKKAAMRVQAAFPRWKVQSEACADSPAWAIVKKAGEWAADLVVVGSHNQPKMTRFFWGSVAQKIVTEAPCSVRIIHGNPEETTSPVRMIIGVDGSRDSELALNAVAGRTWKKGSAAHLITVVDMRMSNAVAVSGSITEKWLKKQDREEKKWIERMSKDFEKRLKSSGLIVSTLIKEGEPKRLLVDEAERWGADTIFVGARGLNMIEKFFIGSVSSAVATRAHCTVEVVRAKAGGKGARNEFKK